MDLASPEQHYNLQLSALAASPNPQWTEYEMQSVDEWIARQDIKLDRAQAIRRLVELGLKAETR